jgi:hypothetical protein
MNVPDELEPNCMPFINLVGKRFYVLTDGTFKTTNPDGSTGTIVVPTGASMAIWTMATIQRV